MGDPSLDHFVTIYDLGEDALREIEITVKHDLRNTEQMNLQFNEANDRNVENEIESKNFVKWTNTIPATQLVNEWHPSTQLAILKMQLYDTEQKLEIARKKTEIARRNLKMEWDDLEEKEKQLRQNFISFDTFVHENNEKRLRAIKKINEDRNLKNQRQECIENIEEKIAKIEQVQKTMTIEIQKFLIIKKYLDQVVFTNKQYESIRDVLCRFQNLMWAKNKMSASQKNNLDILEHAKKSMMKLIEEKNFVIMGLNNQIANLQARYENANIKALESEELVTHIKNNAVKQLGELDTVKNSIWNAYVHMATSKKHPIKIKKDNVEEQMMYINRTLTELSKVNKLIKKKASKAK